MRNPFRRVVPRPEFWWGFLVLALFGAVFEGLARYPLTVAEQGGHAGQIAQSREQFHKQCMVIGATFGMAAGLYAAVRVIRFSPALNFRYRAWLRSTPWQPGQPLPWGPAHFVWEDAAVLGLIVFSSRPWAIGWTSAVIQCLMGITVFGALTAFWIEPRGAAGAGWTILFLLPMAIAAEVTQQPYGIAAALALGCLVIVLANRGIDVALRRFDDWPKLLEPRNSPASFVEQLSPEGNSPDAASQVGWPFAVLSPKVRPERLARKDAMLWSLWCGWTALCFELAVPDRIGIAMFSFLLIAFSIGVRLMLYFPDTQLDVWSFLRSGQFLSWSRDRAFFAPGIATAMLGLGVLAMVYPAVEIWLVPSWVTASMVVLTLSGPTLEDWRLTGAIHSTSWRFEAAGRAQQRRVMPSASTG